MTKKNKIELSWEDVEERAEAVFVGIGSAFNTAGPLRCYAIPNGGFHAWNAVVMASLRLDGPSLVLTDTVEDADIILDDIFDSGATLRTVRNFEKEQGSSQATFYALVDKPQEGLEGVWVCFPWEGKEVPGREAVDGPTDAVTRILQFIGEDPKREGLLETPKRVVKSYSEIFAGYKQTPEQHLKTFSEGACDEMVVLKDIEFYSVCEHHMQPFFGRAHIAYIPDNRVVGISKLARILEVFARRLQIQERLTTQIVDALEEHLKPKGAACIIEAQHFCMVCRGVNKQNSVMVTSAMNGVFRNDKNQARLELLSFIRS